MRQLRGTKMKNSAVDIVMLQTKKVETYRSKNTKIVEPQKSKVSLSNKRHAARQITRFSKLIWNLSNDIGALHLRKLAETLFYEAYIVAGGDTDLDNLEMR
jgi:hypothetical protein